MKKIPLLIYVFYCTIFIIFLVHANKLYTHWYQGRTGNLWPLGVYFAHVGTLKTTFFYFVHLNYCLFFFNQTLCDNEASMSLNFNFSNSTRNITMYSRCRWWDESKSQVILKYKNITMSSWFMVIDNNGINIQLKKISVFQIDRSVYYSGSGYIWLLRKRLICCSGVAFNKIWQYIFLIPRVWYSTSVIHIVSSFNKLEIII